MQKVVPRQSRMEKAGIVMGWGLVVFLLAMMAQPLLMMGTWGYMVGIGVNGVAAACYGPLIAWPLRAQRDGAWKWLAVTIVVIALGVTHGMWVEKLAHFVGAGNSGLLGVGFVTIAVFSVAIAAATFSAWPVVVGVVVGGALLIIEKTAIVAVLFAMPMMHVAIAGAITSVALPAYLRRGHPLECDECGYDLRACEGSLCPECGSLRRGGV